MPSTDREGALRLRDGRTLGYAEYGDPKGKPGFFFHGFPGSRLQARVADATAARLGVRIIALERPGFGLSDFKPGRTIGDWPADVTEAADALAIDRFAVMGASLGGPYAAACALAMPDRLTTAAIVSGFAPLDAPGATDGMSRLNHLVLTLGRRLPWLVRLAMWWMGRQARRDPQRLLDMMSADVPEADKAVLARPEVQAVFKDDVVEAFRCGSRGAAWELVLFTRPWGFRLEDICMEVYLWQGEADVNVPPSMGRYQARAIPNCRATFYPDEGHLIAVDHMEEIQAVLFP
jgi:pimeloyl-ACP methyl ester carboxylesterase